MPFGFPKRPSRSSAEGLAKRATESAVKKNAVAFILSPVGLTMIGVAFALAFALIIVVSIAGKASTDPIFAAQVGLDGFFGNTPGDTGTPPPGGGTPPIDTGTPPPQGGFKFYCQYGEVDARGNLTKRGSWNYGSCSIDGGGCGPTTLAMILSSFGFRITPDEVSKQNRQIGCSVNRGTFTQDFSNFIVPWLKSNNFLVAGSLSDTQWSPDLSHYRGTLRLPTIKNYIDQGYLIYGGANVQWAESGGLTSGYDGHAFMITGVDLATNSLTVYDPTFCEGPGLPREVRVLRNVNNFSTGDVRCDSNKNCGWSVAYAIKPGRAPGGQ